MQIRLQVRIGEYLRETGYSDRQIEQGIAYADKRGYSNDDEALIFAVSRIVYTDEQLRAGNLFSIAFGGQPFATADVN